MSSRLRDQAGIAVIGPETFSGDDFADPFDAETDALAHLPFRTEFQAAVALALAELVQASRRTPPKVIAVDGDETLWDGIAGEDGPEHVGLVGARAQLARRLLQWRAAGVLLVLVSNNDEATVRAVLDRPDSLLRAEHFSVVSAGWTPKPERLKAAAEELGLGLDTFMFLDDNAAEIARMRAALPEVLCVTCPPGEGLPDFLTRLWPVVPRAATQEDAARADFYRQDKVREEARSRTTFADFLERLDLEMDFQLLSANTMERSVQLARRTNQFNLRPATVGEAELTGWQQDGEVWTVRARDRFGEYGQVAVVVIRPDGETLEVLGWMMSCRVLGRGAEERVLGWLADRAEALGCPAVRLIAEHTPRNIPVRRLVAALGGGAPEARRAWRQLSSWTGRDCRCMGHHNRRKRGDNRMNPSPETGGDVPARHHEGGPAARGRTGREAVRAGPPRAGLLARFQPPPSPRQSVDSTNAPQGPVSGTPAWGLEQLAKAIVSKAAALLDIKEIDTETDLVRRRLAPRWTAVSSRRARRRRTSTCVWTPSPSTRPGPGASLKLVGSPTESPCRGARRSGAPDGAAATVERP
ncbi:hypothetical protein SVIOM74S_10414 [Streptomyces violarus]